MRLRISPQDECRTLIWTLDQMRQAVEAKMFFVIHAATTEKGQGEIPVALRRFFKPIEPTGPPQAGSLEAPGTDTTQ